MKPRLTSRCISLLCALSLLAGAAAPTCAASTKDVLPNGLTLLTSPAESANVAAIEILVKASALDEPPGKEGLRQMVQQTLARGGENISGDQLAAALDDLAADFGVGVGPDYVEVYLVCLGADLDRALELMAELLRHPKFAPPEVEREREAALRHLRTLGQRPFDIAHFLLCQGLYDDHPYARPPQGTEQSLARITRDDLADFHRRYYLPNNTIVAVAGAGSRQAVLDAVQRHFGDWQPAQIPAPPQAAVMQLDRSILNLRQAPVAEAYFMLGFNVGETRRDVYPVLEVIRALLGRGMGSRFFSALRQRSALAYRATAHYFALRHGGCLAAYVAAEPRRLEETKRAILAEFERLTYEAVSPAELERAQQFAIGSHALERQHTKARAFHLAWYEAIGLGWDYDEAYADALRAVTAEQVQTLARRYFTHYCLGLVMPLSSPAAPGEE